MGDDYLKYSDDAKSVVLGSATMAGSVKSLLDTPILTDDGALTEESGQILTLNGATPNASSAQHCSGTAT